ncbi:MAG: uracil-DNA glycosylase [Chlamydiales bacterium]
MRPPQLKNDWITVLSDEWEQPYLRELAHFLQEERKRHAVYPPPEEVFAAMHCLAFKDVKVVIVGQDPYHGKGQAHGLSFSVKKGVGLPPSLKNIFRELEEDLGISPVASGSLCSWAQQGILLLNAVLTVRAGEPHSHAGRGWERFTDAVVAKLAEREDPVIFVLWGKAAQEKCEAVLECSKGAHFVLTAPHPSPFSAYSGFFGCRHFSKINNLLKRMGKEPINWVLSDG